MIGNIIAFIGIILMVIACIMFVKEQKSKILIFIDILIIICEILAAYFTGRPSYWACTILWIVNLFIAILNIKNN